MCFISSSFVYSYIIKIVKYIVIIKLLFIANYMLKKYKVLLLILLAYITVFAFYPSLKSDFTCVDDGVMVNSNPYITSISYANIKHIFTNYYFKLYHPIVTLSYMIEYHFFKEDPYIYHLDNLLLHLFNVFLVFFIFNKLTKSFFISYIIAILFALHPTRVETVFWISSRKDTLSSLFYLLSIFLYLKIYDNRRIKLFLSLSLISFVLSCMSKPMAVTLPVVIILIDYCFNHFDIKKSIKYLPFIIISAIFCLITLAGYYNADQKGLFTSYTRVINILDAHYNILFYFKNLILSHCSILQPHFYNHFQLPPNNVLYSPALFWLILFFTVYSLKFTKKIFFAIVFFLIILLPSSGVMQTGMAPVADRYIYLAYIGLFYLIAEVILYIYRKFKPGKMFIVLFILSFTVLLFYLTFNRVLLWTDNDKLILNTINKHPESASHAYLVMGNIYKDEKQYDKALLLFNKSYALDNSTDYIYFSLGHTNQLMNKNKEAIQYYSNIPFSSPEFISAVNNVAIIIHDNNKVDKAIDFIENQIKNREITEDYIFYTLASFYFEKKNYDKTIAFLKEALKRNPYKDKYYLFLIDCYKKQNKFREIELLLNDILNRKIKDYKVLNIIGTVFFENEKYKEALKIFSISIKNNSKNPIAYFFLGNIYAMKEKYQTSIVFYTLAILYSDSKTNGEYHFKRAAAWFFLNEYELAFKDMNKSIEKGFDVPDEFIEDVNNKIKGEEK